MVLHIFLIINTKIIIIFSLIKKNRTLSSQYYIIKLPIPKIKPTGKNGA